MDSFTDVYVRNLRKALAESTEGRPLPGAADLLQWIDGHPGLYAGIATGNFRCCALLKLEHFGLIEHISEGGFGDGLLRRVDVVAAAARRCEEAFGEVFDGEDVFVVGDMPHDIEAGRVNGFRTIGVATGSSSHGDLAAHQPTLLLPDLTVAIPTMASMLSVPEWSGFMGGLA
ncbi:MAG: HAD hydrolase-like protein [Chloroflexi bacterium]|nr:HAD hydrolase-like protein [Chloroflexota bacterium]